MNVEEHIETLSERKSMGDFIFPLKECLKLSLNGNESFSAN